MLLSCCTGVVLRTVLVVYFKCLLGSHSKHYYFSIHPSIHSIQRLHTRFLTIDSLALLSDTGSDFTDIGHDLGSILGNLVKVSSSNGFRVKEWGHKTDRGGSHSQKVTSVIKINTRSRVDGQKGKSRAHSLDPAGAARNARKELLKRSAVTVSHDQLCGSLATRDADNVAVFAPFDHIREHDGRNDEFTASVNGCRGVFGCENGSASNHDITTGVLGTKIRKVMQAVGSSKSELTDLEASVNGSCHGLGAVVRGGSTEHGAGTDLGELVKDGFKALGSLHAIEAGSGSKSASNGGTACEGRKSKGHGDREFGGGKSKRVATKIVRNRDIDIKIENGDGWFSAKTCVVETRSCLHVTVTGGPKVYVCHEPMKFHFAGEE